MRKEVKNFYRKELFDHFHNNTNPFVIVTTKIDITNIYNKCDNYYASIAYFINRAVNEVEQFKYRYEKGSIYKYDVLDINYTHRFEDQIGFFYTEYTEDYKDYIEEYKGKKALFLEDHQNIFNTDEGEIWVSYVPWFNFSSLVPSFDKDNTIPQFIWDKFIFEGDRCYINLMIMVHHGFADGYHISQFLEKFNNLIDNIDNYI